jgi:hypothetical protein
MSLKHITINGKKYVVLKEQKLGGFIGTDRNWVIQRIEVAEDRGKNNPKTWEQTPCKFLIEDIDAFEKECSKGLDFAEYNDCGNCNLYSPVPNKQVNKQ